MDDLLKDAIADAKAVRETALENAKIALEEAFTPRLQSMLAKKIQAEIEDEDEMGDDEEVPEEEYQKFFNGALKKYGVSSPDELDDDKKKDFYNYVDKNWQGDNESD